MKFEKLEQIARGMSEVEMADSLRSLVNDNRFAAVLKLIYKQRQLVDSDCSLNVANHHGMLAHGAGVRYCTIELESSIRMLCDPPKRRGQQPPEERKP